MLWLSSVMCLVPTPRATPACWLERGLCSVEADTGGRFERRRRHLCVNYPVLPVCYSNLTSSPAKAGGVGELLAYRHRRGAPHFHHRVHASWYGVSSPAFGVGVFGCPADLVALPFVCGSQAQHV